MITSERIRHSAPARRLRRDVRRQRGGDDQRALSMSAMGDMPMPGGWTLSMAWMPMCGQSWSGCAASFLGMWAVMMAAMMLPSLVPMLARYRDAVGATREPRLAETRLGWLTALVDAGYFVVWTVLGIAVFAVGAASASLVMQWPALARAVPAVGAASDPDRRRSAVHGVEAASSGLLPAGALSAVCRRTPPRRCATACASACTASPPAPA